MGFMGFGRSQEKRLVVVSYEGPGNLRLNGNREHRGGMKQNAAAHSQTVCWIEFNPDGGRTDQGEGPAAERFSATDVGRLLRDLPQLRACHHVLEGLRNGRERCSHPLAWGTPTGSVRGSMAHKGRSKSSEDPIRE